MSHICYCALNETMNSLQSKDTSRPSNKSPVKLILVKRKQKRNQCFLLQFENSEIGFKKRQCNSNNMQSYVNELL